MLSELRCIYHSLQFEFGLGVLKKEKGFFSSYIYLLVLVTDILFLV